MYKRRSNVNEKNDKWITQMGTLREKRREQDRKKRYYKVMVMRAGILIAAVLATGFLIRKPIAKETINEPAEETHETDTLTVEVPEEDLTIEELLEKRAQEQGYTMDVYPQKVLELLDKNPEAKDFVLEYPEKKDTYSTANLAVTSVEGEIPLLIQWDEKWGYYPYAGNIMGLAGCGPTCISMVASYLLEDPSITPIYVADYATRNGHCSDMAGTAWSLMTQGARDLGLNPKEVGLDEDVIRQYLENGRPIICNVGEGIFTEHGHYLLFVGWEDGKIKLNDPNRREFSEKLWEFEEIKDQIKNMWVY